MADSELYKAVLRKTMDLCSRREQCVLDIREKTEAWGAGASETERIISTLIAENFINEERYAAAFVKDKFNYNKWGRIKIAGHLRVKQIPGEIIKQALGSIDNELYVSTLKVMIENHRRSVKAKNKYDLKAKLLRFGLSRGFESSLLYEILNNIDSTTTLEQG
jgi:regulatory protein